MAKGLMFSPPPAPMIPVANEPLPFPGTRPPEPIANDEQDG